MKKQRKKQKKPVTKTAGDNIEQQALSQVNAGHYKEAIGLYKQLLGEADDKEHREQLAYCYLQRAGSFAARGMFKEALVLWENYTQFTDSPYGAYDHYICWLIQSNNKPNIQSAFKQLSAEQLDKQYPDLAALLGLLIITERPEFQQDLPQDSIFIAHVKIVQTAMQAYQDGDQDTLNKTLKQLPYRSAFRDFRSLLTVAQSFPQARANIPDTSPYSLMAQLLAACALNGSELVQDLAKFSHKQRRLIAEIKGFNKKQQKFMETLVQNNDRLSDKVKFNAVLQNQSLCGSDIAQNFCQATLASYPAGRRDFNKHFKPVSAFETNRLKALASERDEFNEFDAEHYWRLCIDALQKENADNNLKIALILRHLAGREPEPFYRNELLIESVDYDAEDLTSYLNILRHHGLYEEDIKDYKQWLKRSIEKFPQSLEVLTLAIQTATRNKAYKKASQYAQKILKIDPLNTFAKDILFSSHLAHARRLIQSNKQHLVEPEIELAEKLKLGKKYQAQTQLMRGLFSFAEQDKKQGIELITESLKSLHPDSVNAHFQGAMEALMTGLPVTTILKGLEPIKGCLLSEQQLTGIIHQLKHYGSDADQQTLLHKAIEKVKSVLKASITQQEYSEEQLLTLSETLSDINAFELLRHCSKWAVTKWNTPIWQYYRLYSEQNGSANKCTYTHLHRLETMRQQAFENKDNRAMVLIDSFVDLYYQIHPERSMGFLDSLLGFDEGEEEDYDEDPLAELFDHLPESIMLKLDKKIAELTKKTSPEQLLTEIASDVGNNREILMAMMKNPDLFTALVLVRAADNLGIDIDVSIDEVLEYFNVSQQTDLFPF